MNIGIFLPRLDSHSGGGYTFSTTILEVLYRFKTEHTFYVFYYGKKIPDVGNVRFVPLLKSRWSNFRFALFLYKKHFRHDVNARGPFYQAAKKYGIDLVWYITPSYEATDRPFLFTVWDLQHRLQPFFPEVSVQGWNWDEREDHYHRILPRATFVLTGTEAGKGEIRDLYDVPNERIRILAQPTPEFAAQNKTPGEKPLRKLPERFLFYPAQYWSHKNHVGLLHALKIANEEKKLDLHMVFSGSDKGNLAHVKAISRQLGLEKKVHYLGFVSQEELVYLYQNAVAMVFPTFFGPDNLPPLEAFSLGCPVIASHVHGSDEQLGKAALLFNPSSEKEMANAIEKVCRDPKFRNELIKNGKKRALEWTPRHYVNGILDIIEEYKPYHRCWK